MKKKLSFCGLLLAAFVVCGTFAGCGGDDHQTPSPTPGGGEEPGGLPGYPEGLTVDAFTDALPNGSKCLGFYAVVDFQANPKLRFRPQFSSAKKPTAYFSAYKASGDGTPCVAVNGGYFGGGKSLSLLIEAGDTKSLAVQKDIYGTSGVEFYPVRAALGQLSDGSFDAAWVYCVADDANRPYAFSSALGNDESTKTFMSEPPTSKTSGARRWKPYYAIGAGPMLVYRGKNVAEENYWKEVFEIGGGQGLSRQPRSAIGATADGKLVIVVCDGRNKRGSAGFTLSEMAEKLISLGCVVGVNLDGGGSSTFVGKDGTVLNMPSDTSGTDPEGATIKERSVPTAVIIAEQ